MMTMANADEIAVRYWRRAKKPRGIARNVRDNEIRDEILAWAADYDRLAELAIHIKPTSSPGRASLSR